MDKRVVIRAEMPDGRVELLFWERRRRLPRSIQFPVLLGFGASPGSGARSSVPRLGAVEVTLRRVIRADHLGPLEAIYG